MKEQDKVEEFTNGRVGMMIDSLAHVTTIRDANPDLKFRPDQIHTVGWPRLDTLREVPRSLPRNSRPRILWAPTHDYVKRGDEQLSTSTCENDRSGASTSLVKPIWIVCSAIGVNKVRTIFF